MTEILDVDLLSFERGDQTSRKAVVDGVRTSLQTGFVYARHDLSETMLDEVFSRACALAFPQSTPPENPKMQGQ